MTDRDLAPLDAWVVLDLFGRQRAAGRITEIKLAGKDFLRLHIPSQNGDQPRTIDYAPEAVYGIEYVDEETARAAASMDRPRLPVESWSARRLLGAGTSQLALGVQDDEDDDDDDEFENEAEGPF